MHALKKQLNMIYEIKIKIAHVQCMSVNLIDSTVII